MMKRIALLFVLVAGVATTSAARSQQPTSKAPPSARVADSVKIKPSPELQKSLDELAAAMQALAHRIASDPELKAAAMQIASGFVNTAHQVVTEQSVVLQDALKTAADRIAAQSQQQQRAKKP
jgi:predicted transcriptional regulator